MSFRGSKQLEILFLQAGEVVAEGAPQMLQAPEGVVVQGIAAEVLHQEQGRSQRKNRGDAKGKTGTTPYFLFSENRELYRLFRALSCTGFSGSQTGTKESGAVPI